MNKVILIGKLTRTPELRNTQVNKTPVVSMSLETNRKYVYNGEEREQKCYVNNIVAWGRTGEQCAKTLVEGQQVEVSGRIQTRRWEDENHVAHYTTEIVVEEISSINGEPIAKQSNSEMGTSSSIDDFSDFGSFTDQITDDINC